MMRKSLSVLICAMLLLSVCAGIATAEQASGEITVWSFLTQAELDSYIEMYNQVNPNVTVEGIVFPGDQFMTKVQAAFRSGVGCPDVITAEIGQLGQLKNTEYLANLSAEPFNAEQFAEQQVPYVATLSRDDEGNLKGLSYQSTPGGLWYRKELALKFLGTEDPAEVSAMVDTWDKIIDLGVQVYADSDGEVALFDSAGAAQTILINAREGGFVDENNNLQPLSFFKGVMETMKRFRDNNVDSKRDGWSAAWGAGFYAEKPYIFVGLPSWGLHYCIKANTPSDATDTDNTWGFAYSPTGYQAGGTWMCIYAGTENVDAAWDWTRTTTVDEDYLDLYVKRTGDMVGFIPMIDKVIESGFRDSFLGDQDIYTYMKNAALAVTPKPMTKYDSAVGDAFGAAIALVLDGQMDVDAALVQMADTIVNTYPEINIVD